MRHVGQLRPVVIAALEVDRHADLSHGERLEVLGALVACDDLGFQRVEEGLVERDGGYHAAHALDIDLVVGRVVSDRFSGLLLGVGDVELGVSAGRHAVVAADRIDRNVAVLRGDARIVEYVAHVDRILDQRRVALDAVARIDHETRTFELRGVDVALALLLLVFGRNDVETLELLHPLLETVGAVDRVVVFVGGARTFLEHQAVDEILGCRGRVHGDRRGGGTRRLAVGEGESEDRLVVRADNALLDGVEVEVEDRVALGFTRGDRLLGQVFVALDFVDVVLLRRERVVSVAGDRDQDLRRVEDRAVAEIALLNLVDVEVLGQESRRAESERVAEHRAHVAVGDVGRLERVALEQTRLDVFGRIEFPRERPGAERRVAHLHLLVVRHEVRAQRVVDLGTARERHEGDRSQNGGGAEHAAEIIAMLHKIGCNYRKSPLLRATGIRASACRLRGRSPIPSVRHPGMPRPHRRHTP